MFDLRQTILPFSLLKISNLFQRMNAGQVIEIIWSEPQIPSDLLKVLPAGSHEVVLLEELRGDDPGFRMKLMKKTAGKTG